MSKTDGWRNRMMRMLLAGMTIAALAVPASAQLNESCTVSALNRTAPVQPNGSWVLPNVPSNQGPVRVRATCVENGITRSGQSELTAIVANGVIQVSEISFDDPEPIPASLTLAAATDTLTSTGQTLQLTTNVTYGDGSTADLTAGSAGTDYRSSNPAIASVDGNGLVTAGVSGVVLISAVNEGTLGVLQLQVATSGDSDGDGLPDDYEVEIGLNPNNPVDALDDQDKDDLSTLEEYRAGLNPRKADTDGDRLRDGEEGTYGTNPLLPDTDSDQVSDGLEVLAASNPLDPNSVNLGPILEALTVQPSSFTLVFNTALGEASRRLTVTAELIDGTKIDARLRRYGTNYNSSNLTVASFGAEDGVVFAGADGTATVTASIGSFNASTQVTVQTFSPTALSFLALPGFPNGVDVSGDYAYVAAGSAGLHVVDVSNLEAPMLKTTIDTPGNANDVRVYGNFAYVADGPSGLQIVDISNPLAPAIVGAQDTPGIATDLVMRGNFVYVADGSAGLRVIAAVNPSAPVIVGFLDTPGNARGIDAVDDMVVIADAQGGVHVISIANPANPVLLGSAHTRPNSVSHAADVEIRGRLAYVADGSDAALGGLRVIDFRNPTTPVLVGSTPDEFGLASVALDERLALGADYFFKNAVPIFDVGAAPAFTAVLDFSKAPSFRDDDGNGIVVRNGVVFLAAARGITDNGTSGDGGLHIGRAHLLEDDLGVAPRVTITAPLTGASVPERKQLALKATATDDIMVGSVQFLVNGVVVAQDFKSPFEATYTVPASVTSLAIGAIATDLGGNQGTAQEVVVAVVPDDKPVVNLLAPVAGVQIIGGSTVLIAAEASDDIQVAKVDFFVNGILRQTMTLAPYRFDFFVPGNTTQISVVAIATDNSGKTASTEPLVLPVEEGTGGCGEASCVPVQAMYVSHFSGPGCTGTESYYLPYDGYRYSCRTWDGIGLCGTIRRTVTNYSARINGGSCEDLWPTGNTLSDFVTVYRGGPPILTVVLAGTGSGTVGSNPAGINCGATCYASFTPGTVLTLTAAAASGSTFAGWSGGGCSGIGSCTVTLSESLPVISATFTVAPSLNVARTGTGSGTVTSSPAGIDCGMTCSASFASGTAVTLTATAAPGSIFAGWSGSCSGINLCAVTMFAPRSVSATFTATITDGCGEASCIPVQGMYVSHFSGPGCTGTESYYLPYDGYRYLCRTWNGTGICGTIRRTVTNYSARINGGPCEDFWPSGNTLSDLVTIYR